MSNKLAGKKVFFTPPVNVFDTIHEQYWLSIIKNNLSPSEIVNPNTQEHAAGYKDGGMEYFKPIVQSCDILVALPFPDGSIGAGIGKQINWALEAGRSVYILNEKEMDVVFNTYFMNVLSIEDTRIKLGRPQK